MRFPTGRIRWLALAIAAAIAWPPTASLGPTTVAASQSVRAGELATACIHGSPTVQRLRAEPLWHSPDGRPGVDQAEESDEGDDGRHVIAVPGVPLLHTLPSLIPIGTIRRLHSVACHSLAVGSLCRLRC